MGGEVTDGVGGGGEEARESGRLRDSLGRAGRRRKEFACVPT